MINMRKGKLIATYELKVVLELGGLRQSRRRSTRQRQDHAALRVGGGRLTFWVTSNWQQAPEVQGGPE